MTTNAFLGRDIRDWERILRSGLAGGIAGCVAKTTVAPLDRVKILFQTSNPEFAKYAGSWSGMMRAVHQIVRDSGIRGLFQGHSATLLRVFPYAGIKFMAYEQFHLLLMPSRTHETNTRRFIAGASSGVVSVLCTYPLELIRVRLAFETRSVSVNGNRPTLSHAVLSIYTEGAPNASSFGQVKIQKTNRLFAAFPIFKFYRGFSVTMLGMIPYAGTSFLAWGFLRSSLLPVPTNGAVKSKLKPMSDLIIGGISGALGQTASYPFEVIRRRMQVGGITTPDRWITWSETVKAIWRQSGWRGFFVGLSIGYIKVIPMTAISYTVWEMGKRVLES